MKLPFDLIEWESEVGTLITETEHSLTLVESSVQADVQEICTPVLAALRANQYMSLWCDRPYLAEQLLPEFTKLDEQAERVQSEHCSYADMLRTFSIRCTQLGQNLQSSPSSASHAVAHAAPPVPIAVSLSARSSASSSPESERVKSPVPGIFSRARQWLGGIAQSVTKILPRSVRSAPETTFGSQGSESPTPAYTLPKFLSQDGLIQNEEFEGSMPPQKPVPRRSAFLSTKM